ncbi:MAG: hypothetical protein NC328_00870 [Muribaculum sp.]|nr:hypothetical protein [Muribaculum sp.]
MKKSLILMTAALGLAFTACDDTSDLGTMQVNQPPVVVESGGVATADLLGTTLDLNNYQNVNLPIMDVAMNSEFPESATISGTLQLSKNKDFSNPQEIAYTSMASEGENKAAAAKDGDVRKLQAFVEGNAVENAFVALFGKAPYEHTVYVRYNMFIQDGTQANILSYEGEEWWPVRTIEMTPVDLKLDVKASYTLHTSTGDNIEMYHSDQHQYDDPNFSAVFTVPEGASDFTLYITPTGEDNVKYGVAPGFDADGKSGRLAEGGTPIRLSDAGPYKIEVNMQTKMYTITFAFKNLWVACKGNNFNFTRNCQSLLTDDYINYYGFAYIYQYWGLTTQADLKGTIFVKGDKDNTLSIADTFITESNGIPQPGKKRGLYYLTANLNKMSYDAVYIETLGVVGSNNNWGNENADGTVTPDAALKAQTKDPTVYSVWTGDVTFDAPGEFKVRANSGWDINLGGPLNNLTLGGDNIKIEEAGTYTITVNLSAHPWTMTVVKK